MRTMRIVFHTIDDHRPKGSELHVVLTIILCGANIFKNLVGSKAEIHKLSLNSFSEPG